MPVDDAARADPGEPPLPAGAVIEGRYRIVDVLGAGGVGVVYRAEHLALRRPVALKVLRPAYVEHESLRPRFDREAKAVASLSHPNIVTVKDYGLAPEGPYLVMELLRGQTLRARLDAGPLTEAEALRIGREVLRGLGYAHGAGLIHRDVKPGNVFLQSIEGQGENVKLLDFGFAKHATTRTDDPVISGADETFGTPAYMSPEQTTGGVLDARADLYSAAIVLYEMLSGHKPFDGELPDIVQQHLTAKVPGLECFLPGRHASKALEAFLDKALAKRPPDRFESASAMMEALDALPRPVIERVVTEAEDEDEGSGTKAKPGRKASEKSDKGEERAQARKTAAGAAGEKSERAGARVRARRRVALGFGVGVLVVVGAVWVFGGDGAEGERERERAGEGERERERERVGARARARAREGAREGARGRERESGTGRGAGTGTVTGTGTGTGTESGTGTGTESGTGTGTGTETGPEEESGAGAAEIADGWDRHPVVPFLAELRERLDGGRRLDDRALEDLRAYSRFNRADPRPHVLMARTYMMRQWWMDALSRYQIALRVDPGMKTHPPVLPDLVQLAAHGDVARGAAGVVVTIYGADAIPVVDAALAAEGLDERVRTRLVELRARLTPR